MGRIDAAWIRERTAPEWSGLTSDQRSAWFDFAMDHPVTYRNGNIKILNGWQMFNYVNVELTVAAYGFLVLDPPTNLDAPAAINFSFTLWNHKAKLAAGDSWYHHRMIINVEEPIPENRLIVFYQWYEWKRPFRTWGFKLFSSRSRMDKRRRGQVLYPGESGQFDLGILRGMTSNPTYHTVGIKGPWKGTHGNRPAGVYHVVSTENGMWTEVPIEI